MEEIIAKQTANIKEKYGLDAYFLKRYHIYRELNSLHETEYILSTEWFPNEQKDDDNDFNPDGTACIDVNLHTEAVKRIIFVGGITYITNSKIFPTADIEEVIEWIEDTTDLMMGRQFQLVKEEEQAFTFRAVVDNIPVYPSGMIKLEFNTEKKLTLFSIDGVFPQEELIKWEPFSLTPESVEDICKQQCTLLEIPLEDEKKWLPVYGISEVFLTNDKSRELPFSLLEQHGKCINMNQVIEWTERAKKHIEMQEIDFSPEVTLAEALQQEPHPDVQPITETEQAACIQAVQAIMQQAFPNESGQWNVTELCRNNGYITAELKPVIQSKRILQHKIKISIDPSSYQPLNVIDTGILLEMTKDFAAAEEIVLTKEEAFEKLAKYIELRPTYVYDEVEQAYIICGKLDSNYGINATNGEIVLLTELV